MAQYETGPIQGHVQMGRPGITREQVLEAADAIAREGMAPTVMAVRKWLGGGSPNNITKWLGEWRQRNESVKIAALPPLPEGVESAMRQVWGAAWKGAQGQLEAEREALSRARKEIEKERAEMLSEIGRLDGQLEEARTENRKTVDALETEHRTHDRTRAEVQEARAVAAEREKRIGSQEAELREVRHQTIETLSKGKANLQSAGALAFGPEGILLVGDSTSAAIFALDTADRGPGKATPVSIAGINEKGSRNGTPSRNSRSPVPL